MLGVYITLKDDDQLVVGCWKAIAEVFPQVKVLDFGSQDTSVARLRKVGAEVVECGPLNPQQYTAYRNDVAEGLDQIFWIDADEYYPPAPLERIKAILEDEAEWNRRGRQIVGQWRNLKCDGDGGFLVSSEVQKGRIAWDPKAYTMVRSWPNERLTCIDYSIVEEEWVSDPEIFCYHGVLLPIRSILPDSTVRRKKKGDRRAQFDAVCTWTPTDVRWWQE